MAALKFKQVDVFTHKPFRGNPVAVVIGAEQLSNEQMQQIAAWTNLSETTFVLPPSSPAADYRLRIFTPTRELPFAGHPTIGSAHAALESGFTRSKDGKLRQECLAGNLKLTVEQTDAGNQIFVLAPTPKIRSLSAGQAQQLFGALGVAGSGASPPLRVDVGVVWLVANMKDARAVAGLQPDMTALTAVSRATQATGVTVFGKSDDGRSALHARSFAPLLGVPEDPVCGSGNASIAAFLMHSGLLDGFGSRYVARQGMQVGRDGQVAVRIDGQTIQIGGYAITCVEGEIRID